MPRQSLEQFFNSREWRELKTACATEGLAKEVDALKTKLEEGLKTLREELMAEIAKAKEEAIRVHL